MNKLEEIQQYLNDMGFEWIYVSYLPNYPKNGNHLRISIVDIGLYIEYGLDTFFYNDFKTKSSYKLWYVSDDTDENLLIEKGFKCYKKAIKEACKAKKKLLQSELDIINNLKLEE